MERRGSIKAWVTSTEYEEKYDHQRNSTNHPTFDTMLKKRLYDTGRKVDFRRKDSYNINCGVDDLQHKQQWIFSRSSRDPNLNL